MWQISFFILVKVKKVGVEKWMTIKNVRKLREKERRSDDCINFMYSLRSFLVSTVPLVTMVSMAFASGKLLVSSFSGVPMLFDLCEALSLC